MAVAEKSGLDIGSILQGVSSVAGLLTPKNTTTKTSGGTTTSSSGLDITNAGRMKLVQDILSGSSGLSAVAGGQRTAGLYNSSTNQQLVNDLVDRTSASVDRDTAKTVSTQTTSPTTQQTVQAPQMGLGSAAALAGGAYGAKKLYDILSKGSDTAATFGSLMGSSDTLGSVASAATGLGGFSDFLNFTGSTPGGLDLLGNSFGGMDFLGGGGGFPALGIGSDLLAGDVNGALGTGAGYMLGNMIAPGIGGPIGSIVSQVLPVDSIVSSVGDLVGGLFGGSVVCTELFRTGALSRELYELDMAHAILTYSRTTLDGYRVWGVPAVRLMRKSKLFYKVAKFLAVNRAHYVSAICGGEFTPWRADLGWAINGVGSGACWIIGKVLKALGKSSPNHLVLLTE